MSARPLPMVTEQAEPAASAARPGTRRRLVIDVDVEAALLAVERLGAVHVRDGTTTTSSFQSIPYLPDKVPASPLRVARTAAIVTAWPDERRMCLSRPLSSPLSRGKLRLQAAVSSGLSSLDTAIAMSGTGGGRDGAWRSDEGLLDRRVTTTSVGVAAEIKRSIDIVDFIGETVQLKKAGTTFKGLCPFHGEKTPSFVVTPARETWKCFGCGRGGDIFSFVMERDGVDFPTALRSPGRPRRRGARRAHHARGCPAQAPPRRARGGHRLLPPRADEPSAGQPALDYLRGRGFTRRDHRAPSSWAARPTPGTP